MLSWDNVLGEAAGMCVAVDDYVENERGLKSKCAVSRSHMLLHAFTKSSLFAYAPSGRPSMSYDTNHACEIHFLSIFHHRVTSQTQMRHQKWGSIHLQS